MKIFTIGHSDIPERELVENLRRHGVQLLTDVRSSPYSTHAAHFNYNAIRAWLPSEGISYLFMGDCLGGIPSKKEYLNHAGKPDYEKMALDEWFLEGMDRLEKLAAEAIVCLMCSEEDPARCHRAALIGSRLAARGAEVLHIRADGSIETEEENAKRRFSPRKNQMDLFS